MWFSWPVIFFFLGNVALLRMLVVVCYEKLHKILKYFSYFFYFIFQLYFNLTPPIHFNASLILRFKFLVLKSFKNQFPSQAICPLNVKVCAYVCSVSFFQMCMYIRVYDFIAQLCRMNSCTLLNVVENPKVRSIKKIKVLFDYDS